MAAASFTAAKFLAPVAARSGGERAPPLPAGASSSSFARAARRGGAHHPRLRTALAVSSDVLAGNKAAQAAPAHPVVSEALLCLAPPSLSDPGCCRGVKIPSCAVSVV
jgi:pyruvate dehydrogenase E1 component alpha subunit